MPAAVDLDKDGFVDGLSHYRLIGNGKAVNLSHKGGRALTDKTSRFWNAITSKQVDDGFQVLIQGELGRRRNQYRVWTTDAEGKVTNKSSWLNGDTMAEQGFEEIFNRDFNSDKFVGEPTYSQSNDKNQDGLFDDLDYYRLMGDGKAVNFTNAAGTLLTDKTSRFWNAVASKQGGAGCQVLLQGERGRHRSEYQVWSTDVNGQVTNKSGWLNGDKMAQNGYEQTFNRDFDSDKFVGVPPGSNLLDQDGNGLVDDISHYALLKGSGDTAEAIDLKDRRGNNLSDDSSRLWNVVYAYDNGNDLDIIVQGERGRRQSEYMHWKADQSGLITQNYRWLSGDQIARDGFESIFGHDFNQSSTIGI